MARRWLNANTVEASAAALALWRDLRRPATARVAEEMIAGVETTVVPPEAPSAAPLVLVPGATELGRNHPRVISLAQALGRRGHLVLVPDLPGLGRGEVTDAAVRAAVAVSRAALERHHTRHGRVALIGISVGGTVALLAAEEPDLGAAVSVVSAIAPYTDLVDLIRLATTGHYRDGASLRPYDAGPYLTLSVARSVCAGLPPGADRDALIGELAAVATDAPEPLSRLGGAAVETPAARAALDLLLNRDPDRFDELLRSLPERMRAHIARLSPVEGADRLRAPVEILLHARDKYVPLAQINAFAAAAPSARVTVSAVLEHADPGARRPRELIRFGGFVIRTLRLARR